jgi:hypothetical protein
VGGADKDSINFTRSHLASCVVHDLLDEYMRSSHREDAAHAAYNKRSGAARASTGRVTPVRGGEVERVSETLVVVVSSEHRYFGMSVSASGSSIGKVRAEGRRVLY